MTNLKDNIWIIGFDSQDNNYKNNKMTAFLLDFLSYDLDRIIYSGKTSEISEEILRNVCELQNVFNTLEYISQDINRYKNYKVTKFTYYDCTVKESVQIACDKEYCIIYKK